MVDFSRLSELVNRKAQPFLPTAFTPHSRFSSPPISDRLNAMAIQLPKNLAETRTFSLNQRGDNHEIMIPDSCKVGALSIDLQGDNCRLIVGERCTIAGLFKIRGNNCSIIIGDETTIGRATLFAMEAGHSIMIGKDCMLSHDIYANTSDSHSIIDLESGARINAPHDIVLEDHVWIGMRAYLSKGVTIGSGSIVAANSVVTKVIPRNVAAGGNPARVLKEGVSWDRRLLPID